MIYYLKRCGHQELGSIGSDGKPQRGRYLFTSMNPKVLSLFPHLSKTQLNDSALMPIISLISNKKIYCNFVYHNDKFHGSQVSNPRNEYRLYLNKGIDENLIFQKNDIVIMRKGNITNDGNTECVYFLDLIKNTDELYPFCNNIIENSDINGGYGLYDGIIEAFENKVKSLNQQTEIVIDASVTKQIENEPKVSDLFSSSSFRDFVMVGYKNLCAITGTVIRSQNFINLEAAHIKPQSHGGLFLPNNGIALSRDLHWAFDKGFFYINDDYKVIVHDEINSDYLKSFHNKKIRVPDDEFFKPNLDNLHYHRDNIYGLFLTSGRL